MSRPPEPAAEPASLAELLPHAYPFLLVDRVLVREPERRAVAVKNLTRNDPLMDADEHLPPPLVVEIMAQTAGLAVEMGTRSEPTFLARVDRFRCRPPFCAGDQLLVSAHVVRRHGGSVKIRATVRVANRWRAAAELVLHGPRPLQAGGGSGGR